MSIKGPITKIAIVLFLFCAALPTVPAAVEIDPLKPRLQQLAQVYLEKYGQEEQISGIGITLMLPSSPPISVYAGQSSRSEEKPITEKSLFQVGSIVKSFIVTALLKLEADPSNHFNIDDPITKFFPEYPRWHAVQIKQLMNMTSGIPDYFTNKALFRTFVFNPYQYHQSKDWVDQLYQQSLLFPPGMQFNYSNTNYFILGMLIERLTGLPLAQVLDEQIIKPYALQSTYFVPHQPPSSLRPYLVNGYQNEKGFAKLIPRGTDVTNYSLSYLNAAGGMISNSSDVAKWAKVLFSPGVVLTRGQWQKMITVVSEKTGRHAYALGSRDPYGYGLGIGVQYSSNLNTTFFIYQGMTLGYRAIYVYIPKYKIVIAITVNSSFDGKENHLVALINQIGSLIL